MRRCGLSALRGAHAMQGSAPEHSTVTSKGGRVPARTSATTSRSRACSASLAPSCVASARRPACMSVMVTCAAPAARAAISVSSPTAPAPVTSTRAPGATPPRRTAASATLSGSSSAPSSSDTPAGSKWQKAAGCSRRCASAPGHFDRKEPRKRTSRHRLYRPSRHVRHRPHGTPASSATRSPGCAARRRSVSARAAVRMRLRRHAGAPSAASRRRPPPPPRRWPRAPSRPGTPPSSAGSSSAP